MELILVTLTIVSAIAALVFFSPAIIEFCVAAVRFVLSITISTLTFIKNVISLITDNVLRLHQLCDGCREVTPQSL